MKKTAVIIPLVITALFIGFTLGLFVGRNFNHSEIQTTRLEMGEPALSDMIPPSVTEADFPININTADFEELCSLPGVGETLAQRILDFREDHGPFRHAEELLMIEGMGPQTFENLLDYITTGG